MPSEMSEFATQREEFVISDFLVTVDLSLTLVSKCTSIPGKRDHDIVLTDANVIPPKTFDGICNKHATTRNRSKQNPKSAPKTKTGNNLNHKQPNTKRTHGQPSEQHRPSLPPPLSKKAATEQPEPIVGLPFRNKKLIFTIDGKMG